MTDIAKIAAGLIKRIEAGECTNEIDVLIEIALFDPVFEFHTVAIRSNNAGNKVIYTMRDGREGTYLARDWTMDCNRAETLERLHTLAVRNHLISQRDTTADNQQQPQVRG